MQRMKHLLRAYLHNNGWTDSARFTVLNADVAVFCVGYDRYFAQMTEEKKLVCVKIA